MNCKQPKSQLALLIGQDLEPAVAAEVRQHLEQCNGCRDHYQRLSTCLEVLQTPSDVGSWNTSGESLWPKLSVRLASQAANRKPHRFNGWAPSLAVAAACTAMFWLASRSINDVPPAPQLQLQPVNESQIPPGFFRDPPRPGDDQSDILSSLRPQNVTGHSRILDETQR